MARSTRKSLAGSAAAAAKRVIGRRSAADETKTSKNNAKKAPAKKTAPAAKKSAPAKKAAPAKSTAKKSAPAKKAAPAKSTAKKSAPAKKAAPAKSTAKKSAPAKKAAPEKKAAPVAKKSAPAKSTTKKAPASALVVKEGEGSWTKAELNEVLGELHTQREKLAHVIEDAETDLAGLMKDAGDGAGHDQADMGATSFERDHELTVVNLERDMVAQIDRALARIDDGSYGICESCGQPIGKMRLMAFPRATLCMSCKQREERR